MTDGKEQAFLKRRDEMLRLLERHLQKGEEFATLAERACLSHSHFHRVFRRVMEESPGGMERRLRLEKAAYELRGTNTEVTEVAFDAGYGSLEGFSRAFRRAYGLSPTSYRSQAQATQALPGQSRIHYDPHTQNLWVMSQRGTENMDLTDRLIDNDYWSKRRLLEWAITLTDDQLDAPLVFRLNLIPFAEPEQTLREALSRMIYDGWAIAMMESAKWPSADVTTGQSAIHSVPEMLARLDGYYKDYSGFVNKVKTENLWETEWLDDGCEPAETFTFGTTIEATLTWGIARRMVVQRLLEQLGLPWRP